MDKILSAAKSLQGEITIPGDKSISHRAVMFGSIAEGISTIHGFLNAADPNSTIQCFRNLGVNIQKDKEKIVIHGKGLYGLTQPNNELDAGNSGTTIRLITGILSGQKFSSSISGDQYLVKRPMKRIIEPLIQMGASISSNEKFTAPLQISPVHSLHSIDYKLPIASAQVKSAVLLAGYYAQGVTHVIETEPSRDHTERMLGLKKEIANNTTIISVEGGSKILPKDFIVPGDPSSAAFFVVAGLIIPNSELLIKNVCINPSRIGYIEILKKMGGSIHIENVRENGGEPIGDVIVKSSTLTSNIVIRGEIIPNIIDEIPILSIAAAFADGTFEIHDAQDLRNKETDRISAILFNLRKMGIIVEEFPDGFAFQSKSNLYSAEFDSFGDHRIAMAFGIASLALQGESIILDAECVEISFPTFWQLVESVQ